MPDSQITDPDAREPDQLGDYTAHIAHDLNNLFAVVIGSLGIVLDEYGDRPLDDEAMTLIEDAVSAGRDGARLIESLLAAAGRQALRRERIDVASVLASVEESLLRTVGPSIVVEVRIAPDAGAVWTDRERLRQSLIALAENGCEAMHDGGALRIEALSRPLADDMPGVALRVIDEGVGMTSEVLARAKEPFYSTHNPRRGRGLGLSIADGFARQSGGRLDLASTPDSGTTITISLPAAG